MRILVAIVILACSVSLVQAQRVQTGPHRGVAEVAIGEDVYDFLRHLSVRGLIDDFSEAVLPMSEHDVVRFLQAVPVQELSVSENAQLQKYLRTYAREPYRAVTLFAADSADDLLFAGIPTDDDKYLYRWRDDSTMSDLQVHGIATLEVRNRTKPETGRAELGVIGGRFSGTLGGHVGYYMETTNGQTFGDSTVTAEDPSIARNKNFAYYTHTFFDNTTGELSYTYDWFTAKIAREPIAFGGSYQGNNVIVSPDIQMPDFVSIGAHYGAVRYTATVASLLGEARWSVPPDSVYYATGAGAYIDPKYLTIHDLTFQIGHRVEIGFTDMVIFSRRFDLAYINPFTFLKTVEASLNDRDNGLLGMHARWRVTDGVELRGQGLLDDIVASKIGTGFWSNKFAWQIGAMWAAPFGLRDVDVALEHTRVEPYTYTHFNTQNAFTTSGQVIGAAIGPNSISWWGMLRWAPSEKLALEATMLYVAHGENIYDSTGVLVYNAGGDYELSIKSDADGARKYSILNGRRVNTFTLQATARYELWRGISLVGSVLNRSVDYPAGTPANPLEKPYGQISLGARALF
ncbi:MAG: hypothetical protein JSS75_13930 [Bacteroidetes bacterium]|nr:hypothetical protein [Bacteroidota bacterium]